MRNLRSTLLLLSTLSIGACAGDGTDGAAGAPGTAGTDGTNGTNGTDGSAVLTGTLAPGEFLSLEHGLGEGDKFYEAQFSVDGVIYDHGDYAVVRPGHRADGAWFGSDDLGYYTDDLAAAIRPTGDIVAVTSGYSVGLGEKVFMLENRSVDGTVVSSIDVFPAISNDGAASVEMYDPSVVVLGDGGVVVVFEANGYDSDTGLYFDGVMRSSYDASGVLVDSDEYGEWGGDREYYSFDAIATADGGFAMAMAGDDNSTGGQFLEVVSWAPGGGMTSFEVDDNDSSYGRIAQLDDGRYALLVEREFDEDGLAGIDLLIAQADGTLDTEVRLQNSYLTDDSEVVAGAQGTILVAAESGGPDLPFYAVIANDGTVVMPSTGMSGWENDMIQAAAFADGDFLVMVAEDDSNAPMTWAISAQGALLRPMVVGDVTVVPDDVRGAFMPGPGNTLMHLAPSYDSDVAPYLSTYHKGVLQLRVESEDEVRLYNETPDTLDVTLVAHRTP